MRMSDWSSDVCSSDLRRILDGGDGVADAGLADVLDLRGDEADLARPQFAQLLDLGPETADAVDQMLGAADHELDALALLDDAVDRKSTRLNSSHSCANRMQSSA